MFAPVPISPHPPFSTGSSGGATYTLTADVGTFTLTGQAANLVYSRVFTADVGTFALTGQAVNFVYTPIPGAATTQQGGGDSTRLRKRGRRPKYFWEAALTKKSKTTVAEAVFDAVADAYLIESDSEFFTQIKYLQKLNQRLSDLRYADLAHQVDIALKDLAYQEQLREQRAQTAIIAAEESELRELLEIM